jgi:Integrase zinc binding domain
MECDGFIWTKNQGEEDIVCILKVESGDTTPYTRILEQAHQVVGHYRPQWMVDYVQCWYWWPKMFKVTEKFCWSCVTCAQTKGKNRKPMRKLHLLPIASRPWESIEMDFMDLFPESEGYDYLWVVICRMSLMVHLIPVNTKTMASWVAKINCEQLRPEVHIEMVA